MTRRRTGVLSLNGDLDVFGVFPHMHIAGRGLRIVAFDRGQTEPPTCLVQARRWDYDWQELALYDEALALQDGATLDLTCSFSTLDRTETTPWGEDTLDEMCMVFLLACPHGGNVR